LIDLAVEEELIDDHLFQLLLLQYYQMIEDVVDQVVGMIEYLY
jgi:hypothetical protein